jgi:hypothetical protein
MQRMNYDDLEEQAKVYKVTDEDIKHGKRFPKFMAWAAGIVFSLIVWGYMILKYFVRP